MRARLRNDAARDALVEVTATGRVHESSAFVLRRALVFTCAGESLRTDVHGDTRQATYIERSGRDHNFAVRDCTAAERDS